MSEITTATCCEQPDEQQLIEMLAQGDVQVIGWLAELYAERLVRRLESQYGMPWDKACDAVQEVFKNLLIRLKKGIGVKIHAGLVPYLFMLVRRASHEFHRKDNAQKRGRHRTVSIDASDNPAGDSLASDCRSGVEDFETKELQAEVHHAIGELDPEQQDIIRMKFCEHLKHEQIAEMLNLSIDQTKYRLRRAQDTLRCLLSRHMDN